MKRVLFLASLAILALSCQKAEILVPGDTTGYSLSFISDKPSFYDETKTAWTGSQVVWEEGNQMRAGYYDINTGTWGKKAPSFKINQGDAEDGIFKPESDILELAENHQYKFYSVYPNTSLVNKDVWDEGGIQPVLVPTEQVLSSVSFDPKADVMVGRSISSYAATSFEKTDRNETTTVEGIQKSNPVSLEWKRLVALSEITFKGLTLSSSTEKIQSVTMKTQEGTALAGTINVDFTSGEFTSNQTTNEVVCKGITPLSGNLTVWFSTLPFVAKELTFEIATNTHTYTRKIENINLDFKRNFRNTLGVNMASDKVTVGDVEGAGIEWVRMSLSDISPEAEVIYVGQVGEKYFALSNDKGTGAAPTAVEVTVEDGKVVSTVEDKIVWNVTVGETANLTLTPNGSNTTWLYCTATNNGVRVGTNDNSTFVVDESGYLKHLGTSRFVGIYNTQDWRCYTSTSTNINNQTFGFYVNTSTNASKKLIGIEATGTPEEFWIGDEFDTTGIIVTALWDDESTTNVTEKCSFSGYDKTVAGKQTITVSYNGKTTTYSIEVKTIANTIETAYSAAKAAEIIDNGKDLNTKVFVRGTVSEIVTQFNPQYGNITFNISEGEGADIKVFQFFRNFMGAGKEKWSSENDAPIVGDEVVGYGQLTKYNSTYEFTEGNYIVDIVRVKREDIEATLSIADITVQQNEDIIPSIETNVTGNYLIEYKSDNENVVIADGDELVCGDETGEATITATLVADGYTTAETTFTVSVTKRSTSTQFSKTYSYGLENWSLTNYTDQRSYYQVPTGTNVTTSVATIKDVFKGKTITSNIIITLNVATYGSGTNPNSNTFLLYSDEGCTNSIAATQGGNMPDSSTYTDVTYTIMAETASYLTDDLAIKITKPGKTIRLKSIKVEFSYE